ncbi:hypothetical protein RI129_000060 [Pyrocoelia pectoralis]|uniref:Retrotransposon gag domain-containing protein n=1 Tax=Pyrocoelia pectoralis TaxID=417401 RepID=A0AAN7Z5C9_9COLE
MANQNVTIQQVNETASTPIFPKFVTPDFFTPGVKNCITFLQEYNRCANSNHWGDDNKIAHLGNFLRGNAYTWYIDYLKNPTNASNTWTDISNDFQRHFGGTTATLAAKHQLRNRKQQIEETVLKYYYELLELANQVNPTNPIAELSEYFLEGLQPGLKADFMLLCPNPDELNSENFRAAVFKLSNIQEMRIRDEIQQRTSPLQSLATKSVNTATNRFNNLQISEPSSSGRRDNQPYRRIPPRTRDARPFVLTVIDRDIMQLPAMLKIIVKIIHVDLIIDGPPKLK